MGIKKKEKKQWREYLFFVSNKVYFLDFFKPEYNIEKIAGSSLGIKRSLDTKLKISKSLKGVYTGAKSKLFGKIINSSTRIKMSNSKAGANNLLYGKNIKNLLNC